MAIRKEMMNMGIPPGASGAIVGSLKDTLTATGTLQSDAVALPAAVNIVTTTAANTGAILPSNIGAGEVIEVMNLGASTLKVYPPVGGAINAIAANGAFSITTLKSARFVCRDNLNFFSSFSA